MIHKSWDRPFKNLVRDINTRDLGQTYHASLFMPGDPGADKKGCKDVLQMLGTQQITKDDILVAVEKDKNIANNILQWCGDNKFTRYAVCHCNLANLDLRALETKFGQRVDFSYVYLDACTELTRGLYPNLKRISQNFQPGARKIFAFSAYREVTWYRECWQRFANSQISPLKYQAFCENGYEQVSPQRLPAGTPSRAFVVRELLRGLFGNEHSKMLLYRDNKQWMCVLEYPGQITNVSSAVLQSAA